MRNWNVRQVLPYAGLLKLEVSPALVPLSIATVTVTISLYLSDDSLLGLAAALLCLANNLICCHLYPLIEVSKFSSVQFRDPFCWTLNWTKSSVQVQGHIFLNPELNFGLRFSLGSNLFKPVFLLCIKSQTF